MPKTRETHCRVGIVPAMPRVRNWDVLIQDAGCANVVVCVELCLILSRLKREVRSGWKLRCWDAGDIAVGKLNVFVLSLRCLLVEYRS